MLHGCPTHDLWASCGPGWLWMQPNRKSEIYLKLFFAHQFSLVYKMCGPGQLFFQCGPETPKVRFPCPTSFLLTKFYQWFIPWFKFFLFYKMVLKYFSSIFTLSCSHLALWVCLTNFKINYSLPYERSINIEASPLVFYHFTVSIITGTFLSDSVYVCVCVSFDMKNKQNINKRRKEMKWDF